WIESLALSDDERSIVVATNVGAGDNAARVIDLESGSVMARLHGHRQKISRACYTRDPEKIVTASADGTLRVWDPVTFRCERTLTGHTEFVNDVVPIDNGRVLSAS